MKICHVCSAHSVDDTRVFHKECVSLAAAGYDVHLIATGEIKEGRKEYQHQGVTVHPLPKPPSRRERLKRRAMVARLAAAINPDLFHVHEPELLGPVISAAKGRPVIWDVHESYLDVLMDRHWIPKRLRPLLCSAWDRSERRLLKKCAGVVAVTEQVAQRYKALHHNVQIIANYPDIKSFDALPLPTRDGKTCVYAGSISSNRGMPVAFEALAILKKRGLSPTFKLAGRASSEEYLQSLLAKAKELEIAELVHYEGVLSRGDSVLLENNASISVLPSLPYGNNLAAIPVKMIECMALGLPIVYSDLPNHEAIAGPAKAGIGFDVEKPEQMADAIEYLIKNPQEAQQMGEAARRAVHEKLNWDAEFPKLLALYREVLA